MVAVDFPELKSSTVFLVVDTLNELNIQALACHHIIRPHYEHKYTINTSYGSGAVAFESTLCIMHHSNLTFCACCVVASLLGNCT